MTASVLAKSPTARRSMSPDRGVTDEHAASITHRVAVGVEWRPRTALPVVPVDQPENLAASVFRILAVVRHMIALICHRRSWLWPRAHGPAGRRNLQRCI
jgi:hypothetical protein